MICHSWHEAFRLRADDCIDSGAGFNDFYRYADRFLTVPLLTG